MRIPEARRGLRLAFAAALPCALLATGAGAAPASAGEAATLAPRALVEPLHQATLAAQIDGRVVRLPYRAGDGFRKGAVLAQFDCTIYRAAKRAAAAQLQQTQEKLSNDRKLAALHSVGMLDVALAEGDVQKALAALTIAQAHVDGCSVRAPYDGRVVERKVHEDESVTDGQPLIRILDDTGFRIEVIVPSSWLSWLRRGTRFRVHIDDLGRDCRARVTRIGARVDPTSQSVRLRARIEGSSRGLLAGMSGSAEFAHAVR